MSSILQLIDVSKKTTLLVDTQLVPSTVNVHTSGRRWKACVSSAGEGFKSWGQLPHLTSISLQNGWRIGDEAMQALGSCQAPLRCLNMKGCRLVTNAGLAALVSLHHLTHLSLQASHLLLAHAAHQQSSH